MDTIKSLRHSLPNFTEHEKELGLIWPEAYKMYHEKMEASFKSVKDETFDAIKDAKASNTSLPPNIQTSLNELHQKIQEEVVAHCHSKFDFGGDEENKLVSALKFQLKKYADELELLASSIIRPVIGIDLGTTFCCVAVYHEGKVSIVPNAVGLNTTPSFVGFDDGYDFVGQPAKDQANLNPENTIFDAKRLIGRKFNERIVQDDIKLWPFEVISDENDNPKIKVQDDTYYPEDISAKILATLKQDAENFIKDVKITDAVITVPAYFNNGQRQATKDAGKIAGLNVLQILNEPTAAAITYSLHRIEPATRNILIFDLGGGTFDVSVLTVTKGTIKILAVGGDTHLGGEDFDGIMVDYCIQEFKKKTGLDLAQGKNSPDPNIKFKTNKNLRRLRNECEKQKCHLSFAPRATIALDNMHGDTDLRVVITRQKLEELIQEKLTQCIDTVDKVLQDIPGLTKEAINDVVLVGGSTRIPKIQEMLQEYFGGKALSKAIHPDEAVAYGAAILACLLGQGKDQLENPIEISDVTPLPLGVLVLEGEFSVVVPKNTTVPCQVSKNYRTREDNQTSIWIPIYEGENKMAVENHFLGEISLHNIRPAPAGQEKYDIVMKINSEGILSVEATCHTNTQNQEAIQISLTNGRPKH